MLKALQASAVKLVDRLAANNQEPALAIRIAVVGVTATAFTSPGVLLAVGNANELIVIEVHSEGRPAMPLLGYQYEVLGVDSCHNLKLHHDAAGSCQDIGVAAVHTVELSAVHAVLENKLSHPLVLHTDLQRDLPYPHNSRPAFVAHILLQTAVAGQAVPTAFESETGPQVLVAVGQCPGRHHIGGFISWPEFSVLKHHAAEECVELEASLSHPLSKDDPNSRCDDSLVKCELVGAANGNKDKRFTVLVTHYFVGLILVANYDADEAHSQGWLRPELYSPIAVDFR